MATASPLPSRVIHKDKYRTLQRRTISIERPTFFNKPSTVTRNSYLIALSLAGAPTQKLSVQLVSTKSDPQLHLYTSRHQSAISYLASFISSAGQIFDRLAHSFVNSMTILRFNTENRKELSRSEARIVGPGGCICSKERNGINVANILTNYSGIQFFNYRSSQTYCLF